MHVQHIIMAVFAVVVGICSVAELLIHGTFIAPYIEKCGERSVGFFALGLGGWALLKDYRTARRLCHQRGLRPGWILGFQVVLIIQVVSMVMIPMLALL
jgi:hypothetical protein